MDEEWTKEEIEHMQVKQMIENEMIKNRKNYCIVYLDSGSKPIIFIHKEFKNGKEVKR